MRDMATFYVQLWKAHVATFRGDSKAEEQAVEVIKPCFEDVPLPVNLTLNMISLILFHLLLMKAAFSSDLVVFSLRYVCMPALLGSFAYIYYRFGQRGFDFTATNIIRYVSNWMLMQTMAAMNWTQSIIVYFVALLVEPLLPATWQGTYVFPTETMEDYFKLITYSAAVLSALVVVLAPVHKYAYKLNMNLVGRQAELTVAETVAEIFYTYATSMGLWMTTIPYVVLHNQVAPFHKVHVLVAAVEVGFLHQTLPYKFAMMHRLAHKVKPLYHMMHIEHHVTKGIYANTAGVGAWEIWAYHQAGFTHLALAGLPHFLYVVFMAQNVFVHTMWPAASWAQWHTLHHVINADVYAANIPSHHDKENSKDYARYNDMFLKVSYFTRWAWLSDVVVGFIVLFLFATYHFVFDTGFFKVMHLAQR